jgi:ribosomal protein S18 acetylase RimI-like enzyme
MKISEALLSDIPEMNKLVNHAYRGEEAKKGWTFESDLIEGDKRTSEKDLLFLFSNKESIFLVAKNEEEKLIGSVYLEAKNDNLYLGMLSVEPIWQDKGIGKLLVLNAIETAKSLGLKNIQLQVVHLREELISWYKRLGFVLSDKILPFEVPAEFGKPKVPVHFIEMNYPLIME